MIATRSGAFFAGIFDMSCRTNRRGSPQNGEKPVGAYLANLGELNDQGRFFDGGQGFLFDGGQGFLFDGGQGFLFDGGQGFLFDGNLSS